MANNSKSEKKFNNVTLTAFFSNEKFGEGSYLSAEIDAKAYDAIQEYAKTVKIGDKLLFKKAKMQTRNGKDMAFLEVPNFNNNRNNDI